MKEALALAAWRKIFSIMKRESDPIRRALMIMRLVRLIGPLGILLALNTSAHAYAYFRFYNAGSTNAYIEFQNARLGGAWNKANVWPDYTTAAGATSDINQGSCGEYGNFAVGWRFALPPSYSSYTYGETVYVTDGTTNTITVNGITPPITNYANVCITNTAPIPQEFDIRFSLNGTNVPGWEERITLQPYEVWCDSLEQVGTNALTMSWRASSDTNVIAGFMRPTFPTNTYAVTWSTNSAPLAQGVGSGFGRPTPGPAVGPPVGAGGTNANFIDWGTSTNDTRTGFDTMGKQLALLSGAGTGTGEGGEAQGSIAGLKSAMQGLGSGVNAGGGHGTNWNLGYDDGNGTGGTGLVSGAYNDGTNSTTVSNRSAAYAGRYKDSLTPSGYASIGGSRTQSIAFNTNFWNLALIPGGSLVISTMNPTMFDDLFSVVRLSFVWLAWFAFGVYHIHLIARNVSEMHQFGKLSSTANPISFGFALSRVLAAVAFGFFLSAGIAITALCFNWIPQTTENMLSYWDNNSIVSQSYAFLDLWFPMGTFFALACAAAANTITAHLITAFARMAVQILVALALLFSLCPANAHVRVLNCDTNAHWVALTGTNRYYLPPGSQFVIPGFPSTITTDQTTTQSLIAADTDVCFTVGTDPWIAQQATPWDKARTIISTICICGGLLLVARGVYRLILLPAPNI